MTIEQKAKAYNEALERARKIHSETKFDYEKGMIEEIFPEIRESDEHKNWILEYLYDGLRRTDEQYKDEFKAAIAWLEKQKDVSSIERVFRPIVGCSITQAATQAIAQQQLGYKIVLAFNGAYIPVEGKTVKDILNEYYSWIEKGHFKDKNKH